MQKKKGQVVRKVDSYIHSFTHLQSTVPQFTSFFFYLDVITKHIFGKKKKNMEEKGNKS